MKAKQKVKITIDILMTALLMVLMAHSITGQLPHEVAGTGMLLLFLAHLILNRQWFKTLGKGRYNGLRVVQTAVNILLLLDVLALMFSGIRLSRYVFAFLPGLGSAATARQTHMLLSHWSFLLMGVHLGLHWGIVTAMLRRNASPKSMRTLILRWLGRATGLYGAYALWKHEIWMYLSLRSEFIQFDFEQPVALYFLDYFCMMVLFILLAHTAISMIRKNKKEVAES